MISFLVPGIGGYAFDQCRIDQVLLTFASEGHTRGPDALNYVIVSGSVTFYHTDKLYLNLLYFIVGKMSSRAGFCQ